MLSDLKSEIRPIPNNEIFAFVYKSIAGDVQELETNSGCRPKADGDIEQTCLTTDDAEIIEVRLKLQDTWEGVDGVKALGFRFSGSCHYHLSEKKLSGLNVSNVTLLTEDPGGGVRAVKGSYVSIGATAILFGGSAPIRPEPEILRKF